MGSMSSNTWITGERGLHICQPPSGGLTRHGQTEKQIESGGTRGAPAAGLRVMRVTKNLLEGEGGFGGHSSTATVRLGTVKPFWGAVIGG